MVLQLLDLKKARNGCTQHAKTHTTHGAPKPVPRASNTHHALLHWANTALRQRRQRRQSRQTRKLPEIIIAARWCEKQLGNASPFGGPSPRECQVGREPSLSVWRPKPLRFSSFSTRCDNVAVRDASNVNDGSRNQANGCAL